MMSKAIIPGCLLLCILIGSPTLAGPVAFGSDAIVIVAGDQVHYTGMIGAYAGGGIYLYEVFDAQGQNKGQIATFCLERLAAVSESARPVQTVGLNVTNGGWVSDGAGGFRVANPGEFDPLNPESAWLYSQFLLWLKNPDTAFAGLSYVPDFFGTFGADNDQKAASQARWARALQWAIWFYEDEVFTDAGGLLWTRAINPANSVSAHADWNEIAKALIALAAGKSDSSVQAVNPIKVLNGGEILHLQSFPNLVLVPEPSGLSLLGLGLLTVGWLRRRSS